MKRSQINEIMRQAKEFVAQRGFQLPDFAFWSAEDWNTKGHEYDEIRDNMLGWDITDFGSGNFEKEGLFLFTVRNGNLHNQKYGKPYAEKLMISLENQVTPLHFHWKKTEDIINRGGGELVIQCYNSGKQGELLDTPVVVYMDGREFTVQAGETIRITPGNSITLVPGQYHTFWAEGGMTLVGEVSCVNDDCTDNRFYKSVGRFPIIEEDEPAMHLLGNEYPAAKDI